MDTDPQRESAADATDAWPPVRASVLRDALAVGLATGAYGLSFGAISAAIGLSVWQTAALSALMFTGASQFALVGVLGAGGSAVSAALTATLLGTRNAFYGLGLAPRLQVGGLRRFLAAHLVIDESSAMALLRDDDRAGRLAFWSTGLSVFVWWNLATVLGALGAEALADPRVLGLDAAVPAAFLALLAPRMRGGEAWAVALGAAAVALALTPVTAPGIPVLAAAGVAILLGLRAPRWPRRSDEGSR